MDTNPVIANWLLEFLLRQPLGDRTLNSLLSSLRLSNDNANLKKMILLKKLESEVVTRHSISESLLGFLEQLEEIEFRLGKDTVSDAMKRAYCAVAVECTLKSSVNGDDGDNSSRKSRFFNTVRRVWKGRVERMEKVLEKGGLCSEELLVWRDKFVAAVWHDSVYESVVNKGSKGLTATDAVCAYVKAEREKMGPSFLELMVAKVEEDGEEAVKQMLVSVKGTPSHHGDVCNNKQKRRILPMPKFVSSRCSNKAKIVDSVDEITVEPSNSRSQNSPLSTGVKRVREALDLSLLDLQAAVKDPLPDALKLAEAISTTATNMVGDKIQHRVPVKENHDVESNPIIVDGDGVCKESNVHNKQGLPSQRPIDIASLNRDEMKNVKKKRGRRFWTPVEEDALRAGVRRCGEGNWKLILNLYRDKFAERSDDDLRVKWRNMTK